MGEGEGRKGTRPWGLREQVRGPGAFTPREPWRAVGSPEPNLTQVLTGALRWLQGKQTGWKHS